MLSVRKDSLTSARSRNTVRGAGGGIAEEFLRGITGAHSSFPIGRRIRSLSPWQTFAEANTGATLCRHMVCRTPHAELRRVPLLTLFKTVLM